MDPELRRYLNAVVALLSLLVGLLATQLLVSGVSVSPGFLLVPLLIGAVTFAAVGFLTGFSRR